MGRYPFSELLELLLGTCSPGDLERVKVHSLAQGMALPHRDNVAKLDITEAGGQMHGHVLVMLLKSGVFLNIVEAVSVDDNGPLHLHLGYHAR